MFALLALQLAVAAPPSPSSKDSAKLIDHLRDVQFLYFMDWRHEWQSWAVENYNIRLQWLTDNKRTAFDAASKLSNPPVFKPVNDPRCGATSFYRYDADQHSGMARHIAAPARPSLSLCPSWILPFVAAPRVYGWEPDFRVDNRIDIPADEALGIDNALPGEYRDTVRARRTQVLALFDSTAARLPGDRWLAGQRVRMDVDQRELPSALRAGAECRAAWWWCGMLRGYVRFVMHDLPGAAATFDSARGRMPADTLCRWDDLGALLPYVEAKMYEKGSCAQQDTINRRIWWLGTPLYLEPGNDRRTEHYARRVLAVLHAESEVDERQDWRGNYAGPAMFDMVVRYGWPTKVGGGGVPSVDCLGAIPLCLFKRKPAGWSRFNTHALYLGDWTSGGYLGPRYHTLPGWTAVTDPLRAKASDWDVGPARMDTILWDASWWAPEFYDRVEGPLVDLSWQIGFFRRHATAVIAAASGWSIAPAILAPPAHAVVGLITSGSPNEKPHIISVKMDGAHPRALLTPIDSRPLLLGLEMVPENDSGPAGRARFGVAPPPPLSALGAGTIAISDVLLARAGPDEEAPATVQQTLTRMYNSTRLDNPSRLALFWEVYGQRDGDTVDVALRIVRRNTSGLLARAASAVGLGTSGADSILIRWREPRPGDPLATIDSGVTVRPRNLVVDIRGLPAGDYTLDVRVDRRDARVTSNTREFTIVRR